MTIDVGHIIDHGGFNRHDRPQPVTSPARLLRFELLGLFAVAVLAGNVERELGLAFNFGFAAFAVYLIVRQTGHTRKEAAIAQRRRSNLARFFSPMVVDQLEDDDPGLRLERRKIAIMFIDLRGFTAFAESASSEQLRRVLSEFRDIASAIIVRHGGTVDKYIGDGIMAVFGHPAPRADDVARAHWHVRLNWSTRLSAGGSGRKPRVSPL